MNLLRVFAFLAISLTSSLLAAGQQSPVGAAQSSSAPKILKIDPPNWWAQMPKPMLLIWGENLSSAQVRISDSNLKIESKNISDNGHWLELWLSSSPAKAGTITITLSTTQGTTSAQYNFEARRAANDAFAGFSSADVMYLIMPDRFADGDPTNNTQPNMLYDRKDPHAWHGGDLRGIEQHLDYLAELGVTAVWLTPIVQNREKDSYHGYGATDLYAVDDHFGSLADLRSLSDHLHARHMKLILDIVPNHVGPAHPWVEDSPTPDWFHGTAKSHTISDGNFQVLADPSSPWRDRAKVLDGWFVNLLPDLNQENPATSRYLIENTMWWIEEAGADGLRLDTFPYVARSFWHDFHAQLHAEFPKLKTVGEVFNGTIDMPPALNSFFAGGMARVGPDGAIDTGLDTPFDYPMYSAIRNALLRGAPMSAIAEILRQDSFYPHPERLVPLIGSHDTKRFLSEDTATSQKLNLAFTLLLTTRGMPVIYSGDEIAMQGGEDPDNRRDFPGGFDGQHEPSAFDAGTRTPEQRAMFETVKKLLSLRSAYPALQSGGEQIIHADADTLVYVRSIKGPTGALQRIVVAVNKGVKARLLSIDMPGTVLEGAAAAKALIGEQDAITLSSGKLVVRAGAESAVVSEVE
jgi:glycosidase